MHEDVLEDLPESYSWSRMWLGWTRWLLDANQGADYHFIDKGSEYLQDHLLLICFSHPINSWQDNYFRSFHLDIAAFKGLRGGPFICCLVFIKIFSPEIKRLDSQARPFIESGLAAFVSPSTASQHHSLLPLYPQRHVHASLPAFNKFCMQEKRCPNPASILLI